MKKPLRVLIVEDSADDAVLIERELRKGGYAVTSERVETAKTMRAALDRKPWDLIISDYEMPHFSGSEALEVLQASGRDLPFIIVSGTIGEEVAVSLMRAGAHDYLMKGKLARLAPAVERELREAEEHRQRQQANEQVRQSASLLRATLESTADGILVVDTHGKITSYNHQFCAMWRLPEKIMASGDDERVLKCVLEQLREPEAFIAKVRDLYAHQDIESFDTLEFKDGRIFERYSHPQRIGGKPVGRVWSFRDVTARKQAEAELRESEERFAAFMANLPAAAFVKNEAGQTLFANRYLQELLGFQNWEGKTTPEQVASEVGLKMTEDDRKAFAQGPLKLLETLTDSHGSPRTFETIKFPIRIQGKPGLLGGIAVDITERLRMQVELTGKLHELTRWQNVMLGREDRVQEVKREVNELCRRLGEPIRYPSQEKAASGEVPDSPP